MVAGRLIGRERDLAEIGARFAQDHLVTILGPGGAGKTRLAQAWLDRSNDGCNLFCDLSAATTAMDVASSIADALGLGLENATTIDQALDAIVPAITEPTLLVLDNYEQLVDSAAALCPSLMSRCDDLRMLVTSRRRLDVRGEGVVDIGPLTVSFARELFLERARSVHAHLDDGTNATVDEICAALDRLPLAIELAAARMRIMSASELATRLADDTTLLRGSPRAFADRHTTLERAMDWSWALMDEGERLALAQCAVFSGGFTLEAAEAVLSSQHGSVVDMIAALADRSLLVVDRVGTTSRFRLLETIRQYAAIRLDEHELAEQVRLRHARYYVGRGFAWAARAEGPDGAKARVGLKAEQDNLLAVHRWASTRGQAELSARAVISIQPLLIIQGPAALRLTTAEQALEASRDGTVPARLLAWLHLIRADVLLGSGHFDETESELARAVATVSESDDPRLHGRCAWRLGSMARARGMLTDARTHLEASLTIHRRIGDRMHAGRCLAALARVSAENGRYDEAADQAHAALAAHEDTADVRWLGTTSELLGSIAHARGDFERASTFLHDALAHHDGIAHRRGQASAHAALAELAFERGDLSAAEPARPPTQAECAAEHARRGLELLAPVWDLEAKAWLHDVLASQVAHDGDRETAARHHALAIEMFGELGHPGAKALAELQRDLTLADEPTSALHEAIVAVAGPSLTPDAGPRAPSVRRLLVRWARMTAVGLPTDAIVVGDGWLKPPHGPRAELKSRASRRLLRALADHHDTDPGGALSVHALFATGWPGEAALESAAASRVYVAISTLRKAGLKAELQRTEAGYLLDPTVKVVIEDAAAESPSRR